MGKIRNGVMKINSKIIECLLPICNKDIYIGKGLRIRKNVIFNCNGGKLIIGQGAFFNSNSSVNAREYIKIGKSFLAGENVHIYDHNHIFIDLLKPVSVQGFKCKPVNIGDNVWVGSNVTVLGGGNYR
ncbi:MAG: hypothetical protein JTJ12_05710 [Eubacterium sp.]|nr:hypothetical protein [Eubacterium sp.]